MSRKIKFTVVLPANFTAGEAVVTVQAAIRELDALDRTRRRHKLEHRMARKATKRTKVTP